MGAGRFIVKHEVGRLEVAADAEGVPAREREGIAVLTAENAIGRGAADRSLIVHVRLHLVADLVLRLRLAATAVGDKCAALEASLEGVLSDFFDLLSRWRVLICCVVVSDRRCIIILDTEQVDHRADEMRQAVFFIVPVAFLEADTRIKRLHIRDVVLFVGAQFILVPVSDDLGRTVHITAAEWVAGASNFVASTSDPVSVAYVID